MSKFESRLQKYLKNKKAISPVISTIILIVVALVIALLVGVFAFGLFTSQTKSVSLQSGNYYAGTSTFAFSLKDPAAVGTTITTVTINGFGIANAPCTGAGLVAVGAGTSTAESCTTVTAPVAGDTYDYVVNLANGQSISGSAVAQ